MSFNKDKCQQNYKECYIVGWCDAYTTPYKTVFFSNKRRNALVECIRKRRYNFNYTDHQFLEYCAPFYNDNVTCVLDKKEWDSVMAEAYKGIPIGARLLPMDVITRPPKNGVLYEKEKYENKGGLQNV